MIKTTTKIDGMMCGMCEAHICDTIRNAVPKAKKVAEEGSPEELLAKENGIFRRMTQLQNASAGWSI